MSLNNKHAIVTGGGTGIGLAIATALIENGASVSIMGRNLERLNAIADNHPKMHAIAVDITNQESVEKAIKTAKNIAPIDILINNAGDADSGPFQKMNLKRWQFMIDLNLTGTFLMTHIVIHDMIKRGSGRIINIASTAGVIGYTYNTAYCAAKHGVVGLTKSLAKEMENESIFVNAICPGYANTDLVMNAVKKIMTSKGKTEKEAIDGMLAPSGQQKLVEPKEIAEIAIKLCHDNSNGKCIIIDGNNEDKV